MLDAYILIRLVLGRRVACVARNLSAADRADGGGHSRAHDRAFRASMNVVAVDMQCSSRSAEDDGPVVVEHDPVLAVPGDCAG